MGEILWQQKWVGYFCVAFKTANYKNQLLSYLRSRKRFVIPLNDVLKIYQNNTSFNISAIIRTYTCDKLFVLYFTDTLTETIAIFRLQIVLELIKSRDHANWSRDYLEFLTFPFDITRLCELINSYSRFSSTFILSKKFND